MQNFFVFQPFSQNSWVAQLKWLYRPILWASLAMHGCVLLIPVGKEQAKIDPASNLEATPVKIAQLSRVRVPPKPKSKPKPKVRPILQRRKPKPNQPVLRRRTNAVVASTAATPAPSPQASAKSQETPPTTTPTPTSSPTPSTDTPGTRVDAVTEAFAAPLGTLFKEVDAVGGTGQTQKEFLWKQEIPAGPLDFEDPSPFFEDIQAEKGKSGVVTYIYLSPVREDAASFYSSQMAALYTTDGFTSRNVGTYADGPVYEIKKAEEVRYFNIVRGGGKLPGSSSFQQTGLIVVIWKQSPV